MSFIFTSESVSEGHPDKICDQISDAILDAALSEDPLSRVAIEVFTTTGLVIVGGEMTTKASLDIQAIVRETLKRIGYTHAAYGIDAQYCSVLIAIHEQSADISMGVNKGEGFDEGLGAGDQGIMFGYACKQTEALMPLPIHLSHQLMRQLSALRHSKTLSYLRPDAKVQLSIEYENRLQAKRIDTVVLSSQHDESVSHKTLTSDLRDFLHNQLPKNLVDDKTRYFINPTGRFVTGGPHGDTGLTGRKIIVDTYGGWAPHGGGAFSGKDATKVDRSAAYMARYMAKHVIAANLADECLIQLSYAIAYSKPLSIYVDCFGTAKYPHKEIVALLQQTFDMSPEGIITCLKLREPIFEQTACYGHFGYNENQYTWENCDRLSSFYI